MKLDQRDRVPNPVWHPLEHLAIEFTTDKNKYSHNYMPVYIDLFGDRKEEKIKILELGTDVRCRSTRMWEKYFPNGMIYGVDIDSRAKKHESDRIVILQCDLSKEDQVKDLKPKLQALVPDGVDYIIDDASHDTPDIVLCFDNLWDLVRPGGAYIIEDTTKAFWPERRPGKFQSTQMRDYFGAVINALNGDGTPNIHNYERFKREGYPYGNDWTTRIEQITFMAEMVVVKYRKDL